MESLLKLTVFNINCLIILMVAKVVYSQEYTVVPADLPAYEKERMAIVYTNRKQRSDWYYIIETGLVTTQKYKDKITYYHVNGLPDETIFLDAKGIKKTIALHTYNQQLLPYEINEYSPLGNQVSKTIYRYAANKTLAFIEQYKGEKVLVRRITFEVDEAENTVTERLFETPDSVYSKVVYKYTNLDSGMVFRIERYTGEQYYQHYYITNFDEQNRIHTKECRMPDDKLKYYIKYNYMPNGKLQNIEKVFPTERRLKVAEYNYDEQKLLAGMITYDEYGRIASYYKYKYQ